MRHLSTLWHRTLISHSQVTAARSLIDVSDVFIGLSDDCNNHIGPMLRRPLDQLEDVRRLQEDVFDDARDSIHMRCQHFN
jgi:hypothetical protein